MDAVENASPFESLEIVPSPAISKSQVCCQFHPGASIIEDYKAGVQICSDCCLVVGASVKEGGRELRTFSEFGGEDNSEAHESVSPLPSPGYVPLSSFIQKVIIPQKDSTVPVESPACVPTSPPSLSISSQKEDSNNEEVPLYSCKLCDASYGTVGGVKRHVKEKHNLSLVTVQHYSLSFKPIPNIVSKPESLLFTCMFCDKNYKSKSSIKRHVREVHFLMNFKEEYYSRTENEMLVTRKIKSTGAAKFITPRKPIVHSSGVNPPGHVPLHESGVNLDFPTKPFFPMETPACGQEHLGHVGVGPGGGVGEEPVADQVGGADEDDQDPPVEHVQGPRLQHQGHDELGKSSSGVGLVQVKKKVVSKKKKIKTKSKVGFYKELENIILDSSNNEKFQLWKQKSKIQIGTTHLSSATETQPPLSSQVPQSHQNSLTSHLRPSLSSQPGQVPLTGPPSFSSMAIQVPLTNQPFLSSQAGQVPLTGQPSVSSQAGQVPLPCQSSQAGQVPQTGHPSLSSQAGQVPLPCQSSHAGQVPLTGQPSFSSQAVQVPLPCQSSQVEQFPLTGQLSL